MRILFGQKITLSTLFSLTRQHSQAPIHPKLAWKLSHGKAFAVSEAKQPMVPAASFFPKSPCWLGFGMELSGQTR
jgi:hypothetical protein